MTGEITIRPNQADIELIKADLRHINNGMPTAVVRSINRAVDGVKTDMVAIARSTYTAKATAARKNITVAKASTGRIVAYTQSKGEPIGLINFTVRPSTVNPKRKASITVEVIKGKPKPLAHGFVAVMPSGHKAVFKRPKGKWSQPGGSGTPWTKTGNSGRAGRLPMHELSGPRTEDLYAKPENQKKLQDGADKRLTAELKRQADYLFKQRNGLL